MDYVTALLSLLGGLGAFLIGVTLLSDNTEKLAKLIAFFEEAVTSADGAA